MGFLVPLGALAVPAAEASTQAAVGAALFSAGTAAAGAIAGGAMQAVQASERNKAISASMQAQANASQVQQQQLLAASELERQKRIDESQKVMGRLRVAAGEAGIGDNGGTFGALAGQSVYDTERNLGILGQNTTNQLAAVRSGGVANLTQLASSTSSPILSGLSGAIGGFQSGLQIGMGTSSIANTISSGQRANSGPVA